MTMNTTPDHLDPDHLDDGILSALLDGDVGEVGADEGSDATAHLRACDRCAGRQAELGAARAALAAAPVETLDELTRRRLVAAALAAGAGEQAGAGLPPLTAPGTSTGIGRSRRFQRHPALIGSAAAVLLVLLVGIPFVVGNDAGRDGTTLSAQAPEALREESAGSFLGDLGDLSDRDGLRLRLSGAAADASLGYAAPLEPGPSPAAGAPAVSPMPVAGPAGSGLSSPPVAGGRSTASPSTIAPTSGGAGSSNAAKSSAESSTADAAGGPDAFSSNQGDAADRDRMDTDTCVAALLDGPARGGRLTRSGVGTYQGRPAVVASFELEGGTVAFITDRSGCAVLDRFPV
jgi:hypothetical protein